MCLSSSGQGVSWGEGASSSRITSFSCWQRLRKGEPLPKVRGESPEEVPQHAVEVSPRGDKSLSLVVRGRGNEEPYNREGGITLVN